MRSEIAGRSRGTPRIANRLLRRVRDYAQVRADGRITRDIARAALAVYDVDELGLDRLDRSVLTRLCTSFGGGPVGLTTLAVAVGEEPTTVEEVCEPFLVRVGMLARTRPWPGRHSGGLVAPRPADGPRTRRRTPRQRCSTNSRAADRSGRPDLAIGPRLAAPRIGAVDHCSLR